MTTLANSFDYVEGRIHCISWRKNNTTDQNEVVVGLENGTHSSLAICKLESTTNVEQEFESSTSKQILIPISQHQSYHHFKKEDVLCQLKPIGQEQNSIFCASFTTAGNTLFQVYDFSTNKYTAFPSLKQISQTTDMTNYGRNCFTCHESGHVVQADLEKLQIVKTVSCSHLPIHCLEQRGNRGTQFFVGTSNHVVQLWDWSTSQQKPVMSWTVGEGNDPLAIVLDLALHPLNQNYISAADSSGAISLFDLRYIPKQPLRKSFITKQETQQCWQIDFHPLFPDHIVACYESGELIMWDTQQSVNNNKETSFRGKHVAAMSTFDILTQYNHSENFCIAYGREDGMIGTILAESS